MNRDIKEILISEQQIEERCEEIGRQIDQDYAQREPLMVGLLKGSVPFLSELIKHIHLNISVDFMDVSSYEGTNSTGEVRINKDLDYGVAGLEIILVEDIVDTGRTLAKVRDLLYSKGAKDVRIVSLLDKPERRVVKIDPDYVGFRVPNVFVVGYGLDYNQKYRNLPFVGILKEEVYNK